MAKLLKYLVPTLAVICIAGYTLADHSGAYMVIKPRKTTDGKTPEQLGLFAEHFKLSVNDSTRLDAYYMPHTADTTRGTIIFLHGIGNNKNGWVETAQMFNGWGYDALTYDSRAHGASDGMYCTLGFYEKYDVQRAVDWLIRHKSPQRIGIMGNSMGGAVALQALAIEPRLAFGIIECPFSDLSAVVHAYQRRWAMGLDFYQFTDEKLAEAGKIAGFDTREVCPKCIAPQITQPILMIHGTRDVHIPMDQSKQIFAALGSKRKELILVEGADHYTIMAVGGDSLRNTLRDFLLQN